VYTPPRFRETDEAFTLDFVAGNGFATLVSVGENGPIATHVPIDLHRDDSNVPYLLGHMARANPQWRTLSPEHDVLAIYLGPHAYVSPRWYDHPNVPTWNYLAVHVYGRPTVLTRPEDLLPLVRGQVEKYEADPERRYRVESLPPDLLERELRGIVGFRIAITRIEANAKLSQNRGPRDFDNVIAELEKRGDPGSRGVAELMRRKKPKT
jgi:transcriptional regulator